MLGRPNQYISKVTFADLRIEQINSELDPEYFSEEEINEPIGGTIEVFENKKDMKNRKEYIETISSSLSMFAQYIYSTDYAILRIDGDLTPTQAKEYEEIFMNLFENKN